MEHLSVRKPFSWLSWLLAARPKTLIAAFAPILAASSLSLSAAGKFDWPIALCSLLCAIFIQIGTNLVNDALDFKKGADTQERIGPIRATQSGLLSGEQVLAGGYIMFMLAFASCIPLILQGGWVICLIVLISIACGYIYTGGPFPLAYRGLGDLFVFLFFGLVSTVTVFYLHSGTLTLSSFIAGGQVGLLATALIAINNLRDEQQDRLANKRTLAVRFGILFSRSEIAFCLVAPYLMGFYWLGTGLWPAAALPFLAMPLTIKILRRIWIFLPGKVYNQYLADAAKHQLFFVLLMSLGFQL